eukprot:1156718-Pelagomonas_calceolata.AAC.5
MEYLVQERGNCAKNGTLHHPASQPHLTSRAAKPCLGGGTLCVVLAARKEKSTPVNRPRALRKGSLTSKLARVSPKGPEI